MSVTAAALRFQPVSAGWKRSPAETGWKRSWARPLGRPPRRSAPTAAQRPPAPPPAQDTSAQADAHVIDQEEMCRRMRELEKKMPDMRPAKALMGNSSACCRHCVRLRRRPHWPCGARVSWICLADTRLSCAAREHMQGRRSLLCTLPQQRDPCRAHRRRFALGGAH